MNELERRTLLSAAGIGAIAALSKAGPLNPPAGPVAPSGRTLDEVYNKIPTLPNGSGDGRIFIAGGTGPFTISQPGSYVLTGNIEANGTGITISADDVTLDLNGFCISSSNLTNFGINISGSSRAGITVRNGTITGGQAGVFSLNGQHGLVLEDLRISRARQFGINLASTDNRCFIIRRCHIIDTGFTTAAADATLAVTAINLGGDAHRVDTCTISRLYNNTPGGSFRGIVITGSGANNGVIVERCFLTHEVALTTATGITMSGGGGVYRDNTVTLFNTPYSIASNTDGSGNV